MHSINRSTEEARAESGGSSDRFGFAWSAYPELRPEHRVQFRRWTSALHESAWIGSRFLDVGCGMGRNSYWACVAGAAGGLAIDIDERTLAAARKTLGPFPAVEVRHQGIYDTDLRDQFDITFAIGVVHHLEDPLRALRAMVRATRPGGHVLVWVYGSENNKLLLRTLDPLRKAVFSRLPMSLLHGVSWIPAAALWALVRLGLRQPEYFRLIRRFSFRHLRAIVFDQMLPRIAHYWSADEIRGLMDAAGVRELRLVWVNEVSWSVAGTRPADAGGGSGV